MSLLETSGVVFLLSIHQPKELPGHPLYGSIFETFIISDLNKRIYHTGTILPPLYFSEIEPEITSIAFLIAERSAGL